MSEAGEMADQIARAEAREAMARIEGHEELCSERYRSIQAGQTRVETALAALSLERKADTKGVYDFLWKIAIGVIGCMFAIIMALIFKH